MARRGRHPARRLRSPQAKTKSVCTTGKVNKRLTPASCRMVSSRTKTLWNLFRIAGQVNGHPLFQMPNTQTKRCYENASARSRLGAANRAVVHSGSEEGFHIPE